MSFLPHVKYNEEDVFLESHWDQHEFLSAEVSGISKSWTIMLYFGQTLAFWGQFRWGFQIERLWHRRQLLNPLSNYDFASDLVGEYFIQWTKNQHTLTCYLPISEKDIPSAGSRGIIQQPEIILKWSTKISGNSKYIRESWALVCLLSGDKQQ